MRDLSGNLLYSSAAADLVDDHDEDEHLQRALSGRVSSRLLRLNVAPVGDLPGYPIDVLEIYTPLPPAGERREAFALAELYFSARSVLEQRDRAQLDVWLVVCRPPAGGGRRDLRAGRWAGSTSAGSAPGWRRTLPHRAGSARRTGACTWRPRPWRQNANSANEALLAQVGSDIHDGPIQVLTLIILRLSKQGLSPAELAATSALASEALEELRNISSGLVLPELVDLTLAAALHLAIDRHEALTGVGWCGISIPGLQAAR